MSTVNVTSRKRLTSGLRHLNLRAYGMIIALVFIMLLFQVLEVAKLDQNFLTPANINNVIVQNSYILILAIGMMMVIVNGHIDLSVGSVLAFTGAMSAIALSSWGLPWYLAVLVAVGIGALIGVWQGFWIAYVRIPAFIVTLTGMLLFRGLTLWALESKTISIRSQEFRQLGSGYWAQNENNAYHLPTLAIGAVAVAVILWIQLSGRRKAVRTGVATGSATAFWIKTVLLAGTVAIGALTLAAHKGLPIIGIILVALVIVYTFVTNRTVFGRHVYAGGGNEKAAMLSGVKTKQTTFWVFVNMGALSGLAGVVLTARLASATPDAGTMFELHAIASSFIGGASMSGGVGTIIGAVIGGLVMGVMNQGMSILSVGQDMQSVILGLVVLAAVLFDVWNKKRATGGGLPLVGTTPGGSGEAKRKAKDAQAPAESGTDE
ncbi:multiple monosaccharide ABC transporter permease [Glycomyces sp. NRRL B-16210]|uniref:multiple monosaccharide ABC transporter permease n=1 Tax=Glycomyces sp. NRRL B-16210 TaxID=1463821 RepID=UPI0004C0FB49|nr:multiple monosaccharide ABC transporter permease [Glycomyces sp. NRRL B-16210]